MNKRGFTLAETLIAMALVGTLAVITMPMLKTNVNNHTWANTLAAAVSTMETALTTMIPRENVDNLFQTSPWQSLSGSSLSDSNKEDFIKALRLTFPGLKNVEQDGNTYYVNRIRTSSGSLSPADYSDYQVFESKSGVAYLFSIRNSVSDSSVSDEDEILALGGKMHERCGTLMIDVNGRKYPNRRGQDIFNFTRRIYTKFLSSIGISF